MAIKSHDDWYCLGAISCILHLRDQELSLFLIPVEHENDAELFFFSHFNLGGTSDTLKIGPRWSPTERRYPVHGPLHNNSCEYLIRMRYQLIFFCSIQENTQLPDFFYIFRKKWESEIQLNPDRHVAFISLKAWATWAKIANCQCTSSVPQKEYCQV